MHLLICRFFQYIVIIMKVVTELERNRRMQLRIFVSVCVYESCVRVSHHKYRWIILANRGMWWSYLSSLVRRQRS